MTDPRQLDVRTVHRYIRKGVLTPKGYEQVLQELPDLEGEAEFVDYEQSLKSATAEAAPAPESVPVFVDEVPPPAPAAAPPVPAAPPAPAPQVASEPASESGASESAGAGSAVAGSAGSESAGSGSAGSEPEPEQGPETGQDGPLPPKTPES